MADTAATTTTATTKVTPDEVLRFTAPAKSYLCKPSANVYNIDFVAFRIRDMDANKTLFEVRKPDSMPSIPYADLDDADDSWRCIRYCFQTAFLNLKNIGTTLEFTVGELAVPNFRMIERHYFRDRLVQNYDFSFGFCIPNSTNTWEQIYEFPQLEPELKAAMMANPYETKSDSFYFVNDELIMHNKAEYAYSDTPIAQQAADH